MSEKEDKSISVTHDGEIGCGLLIAAIIVAWQLDDIAEALVNIAGALRAGGGP